MNGLQTCAGSAKAIEHAGALLIASQIVTTAGLDVGFPDMRGFYLAGRFGALGEAPPAVVCAIAGVFSPELLAEPVTGGTPRGRQAAASYRDALAQAGRSAFADFTGAGRLADLGERVAASAPIIANPLFAAWRKDSWPTGEWAHDGPGRAALAVHVLREWRGGAHMAALAVTSMDPLQAVLRASGPTTAAFYGWTGTQGHPDVEGEASREAESLTDAACAPVFEAALTESERGELVQLAAEALDHTSRLRSAFGTSV